MGHIGSILSKKVKNKPGKDFVCENGRKLYKPESEFLWKNASPAELHKDSLPHYAEKFEKLKEKFAF